MDKNSKIFVAGHQGLVGSALVKVLKGDGFNNLLLRTREELDLMDQKGVFDFFSQEKPSYVFVAAAKVGGINANSSYPADFLYMNLQIQNNIIEASYRSGVDKLLFLGSSCIYPKKPQIPIREEELLSGPLEPTNEWYAIAKIAGLKMCQAYWKQYGCKFVSVMPTNLYGPGDNYDLQNSHVLPAMIRRFHEAKTAGKDSVTLWGSGSPKREFLYSEDLARACLVVMEKYEVNETINIGCGDDMTIKELAETVASVVGFEGRLEWDTTKPDGTTRKLLESSKIFALGWAPSVTLRDGIALAYEDFLKRFARD
ncbi:MAG: GDP-L-fucose synthase [Verrucomicrobiota bacterium]|nr:GDP-L-fucose synthase [Verrucomicrobiota bacterium]